MHEYYAGTYLLNKSYRALARLLARGSNIPRYFFDTSYRRFICACVEKDREKSAHIAVT